MGRPLIEITEKIIETAESYAARGLNREQIADALGMGVATLYEKMNKYPEFLEAIKRGKAKGIAHVANNLLKNVENGNVTAQIFYLKTQANWKETNGLEVTGKDGAPLAVESIHKDAAQDMTKRFMDKILTKNSDKKENGE